MNATTLFCYVREYRGDAIDRACGTFTVEERHLGDFELPDRA